MMLYPYKMFSNLPNQSFPPQSKHDISNNITVQNIGRGGQLKVHLKMFSEGLVEAHPKISPRSSAVDIN